MEKKIELFFSEDDVREILKNHIISLGYTLEDELDIMVRSEKDIPEGARAGDCLGITAVVTPLNNKILKNSMYGALGVKNGFMDDSNIRKTRRIIDIKLDDSILCETKKEAERICLLAHNLGYRWIDGKTFVGNENWKTYKSKTCYEIKEGTFTKHDPKESIYYSNVLKSTDFPDDINNPEEFYTYDIEQHGNIIIRRYDGKDVCITARIDEDKKYKIFLHVAFLPKRI